MRLKIGNIGKKIIEVLGILVLVGILLSYVSNTIEFTNVDVENLLIVAIVIFFMLSAYGISKVIQNEKIRMLIWVVLVVAIPRLVTLYFCGELYPISDAKTCLDITSLLIENGVTTIQNVELSEYIAMFPVIVFYPFVLSKFIGIIGISIANMQLVNLLFNIITGLLLYGIIKERTEDKQKFATIAVLLWACNPSQFLYTPMLYTENLFVLFVVALLYVYSKYEKKETLSKKQVIGYGMAIGLLLFGAYQSKVAGLIIGIAIIIYEIICLLMQKKSWKNSLQVFAIAILVLVVGNKIYQTCVIQKLLLPEHQNQGTFSAYTFYIGANPDYAGRWNQQDASQALSVVHEKGLVETNREYWEKIWNERYDIDLWEYMQLQLKKFTLYHNPSHSVIENLKIYEEKPELQSFALATYLFETVMIIILCIKLIKKQQFTSRSGLLLLILIGNTMFNMLVESSGRDSYINAIILLLLLLEQWNEDHLKLPKAEK